MSIFGAARKYSITKYTLLKIHFPEKIQFAERIILGLKLSIFGAATRKYTWPQKFTLQRKFTLLRVSLLVASQIYLLLVENTVFELQWQWQWLGNVKRAYWSSALSITISKKSRPFDKNIFFRRGKVQRKKKKKKTKKF